MKPIFVAIILAAALLAVSQYSLNAQTPEQLYQKGLTKEEGEGALQDAINLYNQVADNSNASISLQAKALLHIGMCYEKLGMQEAVKAYQRLVKNFPAQKNEVAYARERLTKLISTAEKASEISLTPKFTKIKIPTNPVNGVLSPDGKRIAFILDGCVWTIPVSGGVDPLIAGEPRKLTDNIGAWDMNNSLAWSGNGKWIAVNAELKSTSTSIYVIPSEGGKPQKVKVPSHQGDWPTTFRLSLSPDGKTLAYATASKIGDYGAFNSQIYTIPVNGETPRELTGPGTQEPVFSPDGSKIAYMKLYKNNDVRPYLPYSELWVIPSEGGTPLQVTNLQSGQLLGPTWSPDGKMISFIRRPGIGDPKEIWIVPVTDKGAPSGAPKKIDLPLPSYHELAGWTTDNKIGVQLMNPEYEIIYTVNSSGGIATQVTPQGWTSYPKWSPDGKKIFFRWSRGKIAYVPSEGGVIDSIPIESEFEMYTAVPGSGNDISPDGKTIVFSGARFFTKDGERKFDVNIFTIPVEGGKPKQLTSIGVELQDRFPCWSPDGNFIAFIRPEIKNGKHIMHIFTVTKEGNDLRQITTESDSVAWAPVDWTPDGKSITFFSKDNTIRFIPVEGGVSRFLLAVDSTNRQGDLAWSPDGKELAYTDMGKILVYSNESGKSKEVKTGVTGHATKLGWSPDGKKIAFTAYAGGDNELWLMENFLPLEKLAQKNEKEDENKSEGIKIRQVWTGPGVDNSGKVSADGKYLSFTNWETGNLMIRNLKTGETKQLTNEATWNRPQQFAEFSVISPDGKQVAYLWYIDKGEKGYYELRLMQVGGQSPTILYSLSKNEYMVPELWSSDNKKIIVQNYIGNTIWQLSSIDIATREVQVLKEKSKPLWIPNLSLSPDDKYLDFDFPNPSDKGNYDIYLMSIDSKNELPLVEHPANDRLVGWLPGRNELLFVSDRSGRTRDLWVKTVIDGKPSGPEMRIYSDIGEAEPIGLTHAGDCFLGFSNRNYNTYIVPFNVETGVVKEGTGKSLTGSNTFVKWSPDGQYLTYTKESNKPNDPWQLTIQDLKTGEEHRIAKNLLTARAPCWSPDGNSILVVGHDKTKYSTKGYKGGIYKIDVSTGQTTEILNISDYKYSASDDEAFPLSDVEWSSDGRSIFYSFFTDRLVKRDLATGEEKILYNHDRFVRFVLRRSPDGRNLLFGVYSPEDKKSHLLTIPVEGGKEKEVCSSQEAISFNSANWSPDGNFIFFVDSEGNNLWRVSAEGGIPQKVWYSKNKIRGFDIHPDGTQILLEKPENITELRVIENLVQELEKLENLKK